MTTETRTTYRLQGTGYEFCNCQPGCSCNFVGFPSSSDGSCKALIGVAIETGRCGEIDLSGVTVAAVIDWPKAIHDGNGKAVFVVPPSVAPEQLGALARIFHGELGGMPWEILGTTYQVVGVVRSEVQIDASGRDCTIALPGVGSATGASLKNPVTGADNNVDILLESGFIWKQGRAGQGTFHVAAEGITLDYEKTSAIQYEFDWRN